MLARLIRLILLFEVSSYFFVGTFLTKLAGWGLGIVCVLVILFALSWRGFMIAVACLYAHAHSSASAGEFHVDIVQRLREFLREWGAFVALTFIEPFDGLLLRADAAKKAMAGQAPLLLVHGYCCNRGFWWWLKPRLEAGGCSVGTLTLEPLYVGIDSYTEQIARRVESLCRETGAERVTLVGHGMGGLACLAYLRFYGEDRVAKLITIATPHQGTVLARHFVGRNAREMTPGSVWLKELADSPIPVPCLSLYGAHDNFVIPQHAALLSGAENRALPGIGHLSLAFSPALLKALLAATASD